jgi:hypothetical protein
MNTHKRLGRVVLRGILMLAFVVGSLGGIAATSSGRGNSGAHQPANNIPVAAAAYSPSTLRISNTPWMY